MPLSPTELNRVADEIVVSDLTLYANVGAPGANGTANRITGAPTVTLAASSWSNASAGDVTYNANADFGVLDGTNNQTVSHYSVFRTTAFVASESLSASVTVIAGGTFRINTGTIAINGSTS